jgi:Family of unknown function (DUF6292)
MTTRADHEPYVRAVAAAAAAVDLEVLDHRITGRPPAVRTAVVTLAAPQSGPYAEVEDGIEVVWDESFGWKAVLPAEAGRSDWFMGESLVPAPARVARWIDMVLVHPDLTPSREDGPTRFPEGEDSAFEAQVSAYATAT